MSLMLETSCPFVNGPAVYKARAIYASIHPGYVFDDLGLCLAVGVYKQSTAPTYIQIDESKLEEINESNFLVYPNPTNEQLNISYHLVDGVSGQFVLQDITGRIVLKTDLDRAATKMSLSLNGIPKGAYIYQFWESGKTLQNGKLIIE